VRFTDPVFKKLARDLHMVYGAEHNTPLATPTQFRR
jgi:hypothetical protein